MPARWSSLKSKVQEFFGHELGQTTSHEGILEMKFSHWSSFVDDWNDWRNQSWFNEFETTAADLPSQIVLFFPLQLCDPKKKVGF